MYNHVNASFGWGSIISQDIISRELGEIQSSKHNTITRELGAHTLTKMTTLEMVKMQFKYAILKPFSVYSGNTWPIIPKCVEGAVAAFAFMREIFVTNRGCCLYVRSAIAPCVAALGFSV